MSSLSFSLSLCGKPEQSGANFLPLHAVQSAAAKRAAECLSEAERSVRFALRRVECLCIFLLKIH